MSTFYANQQASGSGGLGMEGGGGFGNSGGQFDKYVSPEMMNFGLSAGQDLLNKQRDKWLPGATNFWHSLKIYFAVNNKYVLKKLTMILYPMSNKAWKRIPADDSLSSGGEGVQGRKWLLPRDDINSPDLYIPLMSFISFVLLFGLCKGLGSAEFSPEILIQAIWRCFVVQLVEVGAIKIGLSLMQVSLPFLDVFSYTGYKYVGLCVNTFARAFGSTFSMVCALYTTGMLAYFVLKSMAMVVVTPDGAASPGPPRHLMLLGFAAIQAFSAMILNWW